MSKSSRIFKGFALLGVALVLTACNPKVLDPARWDPTMYCKTVQQSFGPDQWCKQHGH